MKGSIMYERATRFYNLGKGFDRRSFMGGSDA